MLSALRTRLVAADAALSAYANASAAVAILLREREGLDVLVMERARRDTDPWSGHWSFPGGRRRADELLFEAVCRETEEEVGLSPRTSDLLGCMVARAPANRPGLLVLPFIFRWDGTGEPASGPEVASVAWVSLAELTRTRTTATITFRDRERPMPAFSDGRRTIWGFTYRLLEDFLALLSQEAGGR